MYTVPEQITRIVSENTQITRKNSDREGDFRGENSTNTNPMK